MVERAKKTFFHSFISFHSFILSFLTEISLLFLPLKKPHTVGVKRLEDQKRQRLVCGKLLENHDPARITQKTMFTCDSEIINTADVMHTLFT